MSEEIEIHASPTQKRIHNIRHKVDAQRPDMPEFAERGKTIVGNLIHFCYQNWGELLTEEWLFENVYPEEDSSNFDEGQLRALIIRSRKKLESTNVQLYSFWGRGELVMASRDPKELFIKPWRFDEVQPDFLPLAEQIMTCSVHPETSTQITNGLTVQEEQFLYTLLTHAPNPVSYEQLYEAIFGDVQASSSDVKTRVQNIKKFFNPDYDFGNFHIQSLRKTVDMEWPAGYRLALGQSRKKRFTSHV